MTQSQIDNDLSFLISAPGKVILFGEHSVVYNKLAIAASLGLRTYLNFSESSSSSITIEIPIVNLSYTIDFNIVRELLNKDLPLNSEPSKNVYIPDLINHDAIVAIVQEFVKKSSSCEFNNYQFISLTSIFYLLFGILHCTNNLKPFTLTIKTDLTLSAGTGSSASFAVTIAACFIHYKNLKSFQEVRNTFNDEEKCLISKWAYCIEKINHGLPSGVDNTICTYGSMLKFRKSDGMEFFKTSEFQLLLINTKIARFTKKQVDIAAKLIKNHTIVFNSILDAMDEIAKSAEHYLMEISDNEDNKKLYQKLGELTDINQCMLQSLGSSHPKLDQICALLKKYGLSGKLTGAGGGGYAISIVPPYISDINLNELMQQLISEDFDPILTKLGGMGVTIH